MPAPTDKKCHIVRPGEAYEGKQALSYNVGISAETVGATGIHMQLATIRAGGRGKAHKHEAHETAIYMLKGSSGVWHGEQLEHHSIVEEGGFIYIPANVPHVPFNPSMTDEAIVVIARTDPNEQESVTLLPDLDGIHA